MVVNTFYEKLRALPNDVFRGNTVSFKLIENEEDLAFVIFDCELSEEQKDLVNPGGFSIGRAYLNPSDNYPCVILNEAGRRIGFINLCKWLANTEAVSWSYYIGSKSQGKGYGRAAAALAISVLSSSFPDSMLKLATESDNLNAQTLYKSLGLERLPELDGDDLVYGMRL